MDSNESSTDRSPYRSPSDRADDKNGPANDRLLGDDLLVVTIWAALGLFGLVTNVITLAGIYQNKKLRHSTSYWLITSLAFCDIGMLLVCLVHLIPATILRERYTRMIDFSNAFGVFVYDAFWYAGVCHLMIMAINRYVNICHPKHYLEIFSHGKTVLIIILSYLAGTTLACPGLFSCCYLIFNYRFYAAQYEPDDTAYRYVDMGVNGCSVIVMTFCYVSIIVRVRRSRIMLEQYRKFCRDQTKTALVYAKSAIHTRRNSVSAKLTRLLRTHTRLSSRREVRLFFQFATVSIIFFLTFFTWSWLPHLSSDSKWIGFAVTSLFFVNNSINPIVYFIFNSALRRQIQKIFCPFNGIGTNVGEGDRGGGGGEGEREDAVEKNEKNTAPASDPVTVRSKRRSVVLRRLRSSASMRRRDEEEKWRNARYLRRRSTAFEPDDDARLLRTPFDSGNDTTDNETETNTTCNLLAMAAFLNTTTITGGVLLRTIKEDEQRRMLGPRRISARLESDNKEHESNNGLDSSCNLDEKKVLLIEEQDLIGNSGSSSDNMKATHDTSLDSPDTDTLSEDGPSIHL